MEPRTFHPLADLFPLLEGDEFDALRDDIAAQGQLEPVWLHADGRILDGRNRYRACCELGVVPHYRTFEGDDDEALAFVLGLNLRRRHLTSSQRAVLGLAIEEYEAELAKERMAEAGASAGPGRKAVETIPHLSDTGKAREKAAVAVGTNARYISDAKRIKAEAPDLLSKVQAGTLTIPDAKRLSRLDADDRAAAVGRIESGESRNAKAAVAAVRAERREGEPLPAAPDGALPDGCTVLRADIADPATYAGIGTILAPGSVDCIITDPPYPREFVGLYGDLARFAAHALRDGGSLVAMAGQSYLPEILDAMRGAGLDYRWTVAYLTPGGQAVQLWQRKVNTFWKPLLWFTKGEYDGGWIGDVTRSEPNDNDKRFHHWGQSESGMADVVRRFSAPDDVVCDPFLGGGTTAVVALDLGRRFVGFDVAQDAVDTARRRIAARIVHDPIVPAEVADAA